MGKNLIQDKVDTNSEWVNNWLNRVFPIGSVYINMNDTYPGDLFGGKWSRVENLFLFGRSDEHPNWEIGGEMYHTLTNDEIPLHGHSLNGRSWWWKDWKVGTPSEYIQAQTMGTPDGSLPDEYNNALCSNFAGIQTRGFGGGQAHNNMPPYVAVSIWYRYE